MVMPERIKKPIKSGWTSLHIPTNNMFGCDFVNQPIKSNSTLICSEMHLHETLKV